MINFKTMILLSTAILTMSATSLTTFAATTSRVPAEIVAELTGRTVEDVRAEKVRTGKTYGTIANDAGKLTEFKEASLKAKKDTLTERVAAGTITQEQADSTMQAIENNAAICDGTGSGLGLGLQQGQGQGQGFGGGYCGGQGYASNSNSNNTDQSNSQSNNNTGAGQGFGGGRGQGGGGRGQGGGQGGRGLRDGSCLY